MKAMVQLFVILLGSAPAWPQAPALPATPAGIEELVLAQPFLLDNGFSFDWRSERPTVSQGFLIVLRVNPDLVYPRQRAEPILYVGDQTAMRLNPGYPSGRVVALVPGDGLTAEGARIWFGTPGLPEQVTAAAIAREQGLAEAGGIEPLPAAVLSAALARGGQALRSPDLDTLLQGAAELIGR